MNAVPSSVMADLERLRRLNNALYVRVVLARLARDPRFKP
jgi:hypothetical protein